MLDLVFCGFMGAGKSKLGRLAAAELQVDFMDLDHVLVEQEGRTISEIFETDGEAAFRVMESRYLEACLALHNRILSLGGGALADRERVERIKSANILVWIDPPFEAILQRVIGDERRPLVRGRTPAEAEAVLRELHARRAPLYALSHIHFRPRPEWLPQESTRNLVHHIRQHLRHVG